MNELSGTGAYHVRAEDVYERPASEEVARSLRAGNVLAAARRWRAPFTSDRSARSRRGVPTATSRSPRQGSDEAPVKLFAFESPQCASCRFFHIGDGYGPSTYDLIVENYVNTEKVQHVEKTLYVGYPWERTAASAQKCVWHIAPEKFHLLTTEYYRSQDRMTSSNLVDFLEQWALANDLDADALPECVESNRYVHEADADVQEGRRAGARGTPTFRPSRRPSRMSLRSEHALRDVRVLTLAVGALIVVLAYSGRLFGAAPPPVGAGVGDGEAFPAAFVGGVLALLSPCTGVVLPAFFAYSYRSRGDLLRQTHVFFLGLALVFVPLGRSSERWPRSP